jgi:hypothetical protein
MVDVVGSGLVRDFLAFRADGREAQGFQVVA